MPCADNTHTAILQPFVPPDTGVQYCFKSPFHAELVESLMFARDPNYFKMDQLPSSGVAGILSGSVFSSVKA
jgi:hypothetical protein